MLAVRPSQRRMLPKRALGEICEVIIGRTPSRAQPRFWGGLNPWLTISDMSQGVDLKKTGEAITDVAVTECHCRRVKPGTVLLSFKLSVGKVGIARVPMYTNEAIAALPVRDPSTVDSTYLAWALRSMDLTAGLDRAAKGLTLNRAKLLELNVPVPGLPEQLRIADVLERAAALSAQRQASLASTILLLQALFAESFGDPIANAGGYDVTTLEKIVDPERPITYGILMPGPVQVRGVKYVRVADMKDGGIDLKGVRMTTKEISVEYKRSLLKAGDLLLSIRGHVGRLAEVPSDLEGANITQDSARLAITGAFRVFVRECLRSPGAQRWMARHTKGVAVQGINLGDVKRLPIILPSASDQGRFASKIAAAEQLLARQRESMAHVDALFVALQNQAFGGSL